MEITRQYLSRLMNVWFWGALLLADSLRLEAQPASLRLAAILQNHAVVQQDKPFAVWGWGTPGTVVSAKASWGSQTETRVNNQGSWQMKLNVPRAIPGDFTPHSITVRSAEQQLNLTDLLIGEVWFCSGQSNMEMTMQAVPPWHKGVDNQTTEIAAADYPMIRLFKVKRETSVRVRDTVQASWQSCRPTTVADFSGVAYYFGRRLQQELKLPVGLIVAAYGGASCQSFMAEEILLNDTLLRKRYWDPYLADPAGKQPHLQPAQVYNAIIHPILPYTVRGHLWYQGESNSGEVKMYPYLNAALIRSWREESAQGEWPFYFVQMTPYNWKKTNPAENGYARFREAQARIVREVPRTGMVCTLDAGDPDDIHPTRKKPVGERLAALALYHDYGRKKITISGPVFHRMQIRGPRVIVHFEKASTTGGLRTSDGLNPAHFFLAGADSVFRPAIARIRGKRIWLKAAGVTHPVALRYAFTNAVQTNLQNSAGWPAFPFRTDSWEKETLLFTPHQP